MKKNYNFYVYLLLDSSKPGIYKYGSYSFDYEPFYVGKGTGKRIKNTLYDKSPYKHNKIKYLKGNNIEIITIKLIENISNEKSIEIEKELIELIGRKDSNKGTLTNLTDGGDGGRLNSFHSEETKKKISIGNKGKSGWKHNKGTLKHLSDMQSGKNNGFYGKNHSDITKKNHSLRMRNKNHPMYGKIHNENSKKIMKIKRQKLSNEKLKLACQKFNKPILQYDLNMNFIQEFKSIKDASKVGITSSTSSTISKCCNGDILNPKKYIFRYKYDKDMIKNNRFIIKIDDIFFYKGKKHKLLVRNKNNCLTLSLNDNKEFILDKSDYKYLFYKESNNFYFSELYRYLNILNNFRIDYKNHLIYNDEFKIIFIYYLEELIFGESDIEDNYIKIYDKDWINNLNKTKLYLSDIIKNE